jgi:hypothetical protein
VISHLITAVAVVDCAVFLYTELQPMLRCCAVLCCAVLCCGLQESQRWQVVQRALAALEAVLQRGSSQACGEVAVMFQSDPSPVRNALNSPQVGSG